MLRLLKALCLCGALLLTPFADSAPTGERQTVVPDYELLKAYRLKYSEEIFRYCVDRLGAFASGLGGCLLAQSDIKARLFADAQRKLGRRSSVQAVYDDCLDYYPVSGVGRVAYCVHSRIQMREILRDDPVEQEIYRRCDFKWRKQGFRAIDTCSLHRAKYYRDRGRYYEDP